MVCVLTSADVPGRNDIGPVMNDEPLLPEGLVRFVGQPLSGQLPQFAVHPGAHESLSSEILKKLLEFSFAAAHHGGQNHDPLGISRSG